MSVIMEKITDFYEFFKENEDPRVEDWLLCKTPIPCLVILALYFVFLWLGPKFMANREPFKLQGVMIAYNFFLVLLSCYMFYEFRTTSWLGNYSYRCQPVDYSNDPLALRMANVCWWFFFSKVIELCDTVIFVLRKKDNQITFLHVYHHSSMIVNWWLGVKFVAGGQSWFLAMCNSFVHIIMYSYYGLAALGPHMQKYLWWKRYMTQIQLNVVYESMDSMYVQALLQVQFFLVLVHTGNNLLTDCNFPQGFNYAVFLYAISMVVLFSNFYSKSYTRKEKSKV